MTVREMATVRKVHAQNLISILNRSQIHRHVCLRTAMWLHVSVLCPEYLFSSIDRSLLDDVRPLAPAVVTLLWVTFGILVRENRAGRFESRS